MTTEIVKKAKAPAKPRTPKAAGEAKAPAKPKAGKTKAEPLVMPSREEIALLAQKYWAERGWQDGAAEQDWLRAEQELLGKAS